MKFCFILLGVIWGSFTFGQSVSGVITDQKNEPIIGASVQVKNTTNGTVTDVNGKYTIGAKSGDVLVINFTGFAEQEIAVGNESTINVVMNENTTLEEIVTVAYGTQRKVTVTGAVVQTSGDKLVKSPAVDITNSLAGRLPGLVVIQQSGEPGYDGALLRIRGVNTLGNSSPLVVIDGIPDRDGGLGRLNAGDIDNISVLKDASAAIYGARAANGAILITTKKGKTGKPTISYDFNIGANQPTVIPKMSNASEYAAIMNEIPIYKNIPQGEWGAAWSAMKSSGVYKSPTAGVSQLSANYSPTAVQNYANGSDPWGYPNTDWFGDAFKTWSGQTKHNLQVSGGTETVNYFASLGYQHQDAYYKNSATFYNQYNFRTNLGAKVSNYITANLGIMARREDRNFPTESAGSIFRMLMRGRPTEPEVWPNGLPGPDIENGQNPYVITTNATGYTKNPTDYLQGNGSLDITNPWIKGLKLTLSGAVDKTTNTNKIWQTPWMLYTWDRVSKNADGTPKLVGAVRSNFKDPRLTQTYENKLNTNLTALLNYDFKLGDNHNFNILAGVTREQFNGDNFLAFRRNYISGALDQLFAGGSLQQNTNGSAYNRARLGYYGRAQYNFSDKYLAEFVWRYDGSYIFPTSGRFGFFPGLLLGYNISQEPWFKVPGIDRLKLRASYGQMGNDQVFYNGQLQEYAFLSTYGFNSYPINGQVVSTLGETVLANPSFTWERAKNYNAGIDATILNGKFDVTLEYFINHRTNILIQKTGSTPASSGINSLLPPVNAGKVDNKGVEFNVVYNGKATKDFQFRAGINGGYAQNKVVFMDEVPGIPDYQKQEGKPIGSYLVYKSDGVFKDQSAIDANKIDYSAVTGKLIPGDMKFQDVNGDGKITADDRVRLNEGLTPKFNFGGSLDLIWKNFSLSALFQGATGSSLRIQTESGDIGNFLKYSYDHRWSIDNPSSTDPRLASRGDTYFTGGNFGNNTYYLFSKNYVRLKNLELGYTLPSDLINKLHLGNARIYVNGLNLFTINALKVYDPESTNQAGTFYPQARVVNAGFNITF